MNILQWHALATNAQAGVNDTKRNQKDIRIFLKTTMTDVCLLSAHSRVLFEQKPLVTTGFLYHANIHKTEPPNINI